MAGWLSRLFGADEPGSSVAQARVHAERSLMALEGVVSVGVGLDDSGHEAIVVGMADEDCAVAQAMPSEVDGVPLVVRRVGGYRAEEAAIEMPADPTGEETP